MEKRFEGFDVHHVPQIQNGDVDELAQLATRQQPLPEGVFLERQNAPSQKEEIAEAKPPEGEDTEMVPVSLADSQPGCHPESIGCPDGID